MTESRRSLLLPPRPMRAASCRRRLPCSYYHEDKRCGFGLYIWVNGDRYEGGWKNGRMHGKGVKIMANGDVYNGMWEDDKAQGWGVKIFSCGDRHEGYYDQDKRHRYGVYTWASGDRYEGYWEHGRMSGRGIKNMANGDVYDGEWREDKAHGWGVKIFANGDQHEGEYKCDLREGQGTYTWANGDSYEVPYRRASRPRAATHHAFASPPRRGDCCSGRRTPQGCVYLYPFSLTFIAAQSPTRDRRARRPGRVNDARGGGGGGGGGGGACPPMKGKLGQRRAGGLRALPLRERRCLRGLLGGGPQARPRLLPRGRRAGLLRDVARGAAAPPQGSSTATASDHEPTALRSSSPCPALVFRTRARASPPPSSLDVHSGGTR